MLTYDQWKLETPEDEYARKNRGRNGWRDYRDTERCWKCGFEFEGAEYDEECCAHCAAHLQDEPAERDPDDARDADRGDWKFHQEHDQ
jgi:hypothetical protein